VTSLTWLWMLATSSTRCFRSFRNPTCFFSANATASSKVNSAWKPSPTFTKMCDVSGTSAWQYTAAHGLARVVPRRLNFRGGREVVVTSVESERKPKNAGYAGAESWDDDGAHWPP